MTASRSENAELFRLTNGGHSFYKQETVHLTMPAYVEHLKIVSQDPTIGFHAAFRFIPRNTESFLSYTTTDRVGIVVFFNQPMTEDANTTTKLWTQQLINTAISLNGTYYLPIQLHADAKHIQAAYPSLHKLLNLRKQHDPHELFTNYFYEKYR
ncbi:MAG: hypothetical protein AB7F19_06645 [Candidatus Babeliales bacterium]